MINGYLTGRALSTLIALIITHSALGTLIIGLIGEDPQRKGARQIWLIWGEERGLP